MPRRDYLEELLTDKAEHAILQRMAQGPVNSRDMAKAVVQNFGVADLLRGLGIVLLFHSGGPWDQEKAARWQEVTGGQEATTKAMCDHLRRLLAKVNPT